MPRVSKKPLRTFNAHETERMQALQGVTLASFKSRGGAFIIDFLLAFGAFLIILIPGAKLAAKMGFAVPDVNLQFDFEHWYSILFLVAFFSVATYWGNGKTPGKWIFGIRVVSLTHERMSLWPSIERALGYGASFLEFGFGFFQYFTHPNRRTVHDRIAETIVVRDRKQHSKSTIKT
jgi:uncharacterized RDD family membrane protein YckC